MNRLFAALLFIVCILLIGGCARSVTQRLEPVDWYRQAGLFDGALKGETKQPCLRDLYLMELACYVSDTNTFELRKTLGSWGFSEQTPFGDPMKSASGFVASNANVVVVAFHGTNPQNSVDWMGNIDALEPAYRESVCLSAQSLVHDGFYKAIADMLPNLVEEIHRQATAGETSRGIWFTGHSRGGAFTVLTACAYMRKHGAANVRGIYTFGQPRVGNDALGKAIEAKAAPYYRVVNGGDPVPNLPPESLKYSHGGKLLFIDYPGRQPKELAPVPQLNTIGPRDFSLIPMIDDHDQWRYQYGLYTLAKNPRFIAALEIARIQPDLAGEELPVPYARPGR